MRSQSCGWRLGGREEIAAGCDAFIDDDGIFGHQRSHRACNADVGDATCGRCGWIQAGDVGRAVVGAQLISQPFERVDHILLGSRQRVELSVRLSEQARFAGISEEGHRAL